IKCPYNYRSKKHILFQNDDCRGNKGSAGDQDNGPISCGNSTPIPSKAYLTSTDIRNGSTADPTEADTQGNESKDSRVSRAMRIKDLQPDVDDNQCDQLGEHKEYR